MSASQEVALDPSKRNLSLDMIRGVAVLLVLVHHTPPDLTQVETVGEPIMTWAIEIGWVGVDLFFVMSGYLISTLVYTEFDGTGAFRPGRFLVRRGFKIWPCYFIGFGVATALRIGLATFRGDSNLAWRLVSDGFINSVFLQNYVACERWTHSWTIAIEEHFYTGFAILAFVILYRNRNRGLDSDGRHRFQFVLPLFFCLALLAFIGRSLATESTYKHSAVYYPTHFRIDSLMYGVLLGYVQRYHPQKIPSFLLSWPVLLASAIIAGALPAIFPLKESRICGTIGFTVLYFCFGNLVLATTRYPRFGQGIPGIRHPLKWLATIRLYSYTIYLAHSFLPMTPGFESTRLAVSQIVSRGFGQYLTTWVGRILFYAVSIAVGWMMARLIERPFLRVRSRVAPSHPQTPANPEGTVRLSENAAFAS